MQNRDTVLATPADTHSGSPLGLMPASQWAFTNGGYHDPDEAQKIISRLWVQAWERVARARRGKRLIVAHVGDAVEGKHHDSSETITPRVDEHERIHIHMMEQALEITQFDPSAGDLLYYVKGTPAHVGQGGSSEERIARNFAGGGVVPKTPPTQESGCDGRYLWDRLRLQVNGKLFDLAHHGVTVGNRAWNRTDALRNKLKEVYFQNLEHGNRPPDYWIRADKHQKAHDVYVNNATGHRMEGFVTPAFQGKTEFGYKVAGDKLSSLGLLFFEISSTGHVEPQWETLEYDQDQVTVV